METIFEYLWKANFLLMLFFCYYYYSLKTETYFNYNRSFLLFGLMSAVVLPAVSFKKVVFINAKNVVVVDNIGVVPIGQTGNIPLNIVNHIDVIAILVTVYCFVAIFLILKIILSYYHYRRIIKNIVLHSENGFKIIKTTAAINPFSFFKTIVYNPSLYSEQELQAIIAHEQIHARQYHSIDVLVSQLFAAAFWYNPLIWFYKKAIVQNLEYIADSCAIKQVQDKTNYQFTLLKFSTNISCIAISNHFYQSLIKKRIVMLNKKPSQKISRWKLAIILPIIALFLYQFQVKIIAQESVVAGTATGSNLLSTYNPIDPILITKNSTDLFFAEITKRLKESENIDVEFSRIKRNIKQEIISIKVVYDDHKGTVSEHEVESDKPIDDFTFVHNTNESGKGEVGFYTEKYDNGKKVSMVSGQHKDSYQSESFGAVAVPMAEMPIPPTPPTPPTPPQISRIKFCKFNAPKPPATPKNMSDSTVLETYAQQMKIYKDNVEAESRRFDAEQQKMSQEQDIKSEAFDALTQDFSRQMQEFDKKMEVFNTKMEMWQNNLNQLSGSKTQQRRTVIKKSVAKRVRTSN